MRKQVEESTAAESARRATRPAAERDRKGRFSARRKRATVLRLLRERPRVLGQWFDGIRFYAAASSPTRSRRTWAGLR